MLKIGEFSRLCQVPTKTLRYYDEIGLLQPAHVDKFTSHRFYTLEQLSHIHRIMTLKELGLSLEQIAKMLQDDLPTEQLRGMLALKAAEVQQRVDDEMARLKRVRFHIRQLDMEATMSQLDVRIKKLEPIHGLTIRFMAKTHADYERVGGEIEAVLKANNIAVVSNLVQIVYADEYNQQNVDTEFVYPVDETWTEDVSLESAGTLIARDVPGIEQAATYIHQGNPDDINESLVDLQRWVAANGYKLGGMLRMMMLRGPAEHLPEDEWMMEIQHPLEKA